MEIELVDTIYFEESVTDHPRTREIFSRFKIARKIPIQRYGEIFNKRNQNFKLQKRNPALILAKKHKGFILPVPEGFGIGHSIQEILEAHRGPFTGEGHKGLYEVLTNSWHAQLTINLALFGSLSIIVSI